MNRIILIGIQGSGKGTQAKLISKKFGIPHISIGDIFRSLPNNTDFEKKIHEMINKGILVPDSDTIKIVEDRLRQDDCKKGFILDGFPRNLNQAKMLKTSIDHVIWFELSDAEAIRRLSSRRQCRNCGKIYGIDVKPKKVGICDNCGGELYQRDDDKPETIMKRLNVFHNETEPLREFYQKFGILRIVDAKGSVEDIFNRIIKALGK